MSDSMSARLTIAPDRTRKFDKDYEHPVEALSHISSHDANGDIGVESEEQQSMKAREARKALGGGRYSDLQESFSPIRTSVETLLFHRKNSDRLLDGVGRRQRGTNELSKSLRTHRCGFTPDELFICSRLVRFIESENGRKLHLQILSSGPLGTQEQFIIPRPSKTCPTGGEKSTLKLVPLQ